MLEKNVLKGILRKKDWEYDEKVFLALLFESKHITSSSLRHGTTSVPVQKPVPRIYCFVSMLSREKSNYKHYIYVFKSVNSSKDFDAKVE